MTCFEATNSVFIINPENNSFSISIPGHWNSKSVKKTIDELNKLLVFRSENDIELHVEQVRKNGMISMNDYSLFSLDTFKNEILEELNSVKYNDLEAFVCSFQLTYDEIIDILDLKCIPTRRPAILQTLNPGIYGKTDTNKTLELILPNKVKISNTIDDIRLKSILKRNQTLKFTKKFFFYTILGFTQSHFYSLNDIDGVYQLIAGSHRSEKLFNITVQNSFEMRLHQRQRHKWYKITYFIQLLSHSSFWP